MADHYSLAVLPARVKKNRDKSKIELSVLLAKRWILVVLRNRQIFSLTEVNTEIRRLLEKLNNKSFRKLPGCRRDLSEQIDKPALKPLPRKPYEFAQWKKVHVHIDYHVEFDEHTTPFPAHVLATSSTCEPAPGSSNACTRGSRSRATGAPVCGASTPPLPSTCPRSIEKWVNGPRSG